MRRVLIAVLGNSKTFFFFMSTNIVLVVFTFFCLPETKNVPLENMDVLFGDVDHVEKGADLVNDLPANAPVPTIEDTKPEATAVDVAPKKQETA